MERRQFMGLFGVGMLASSLPVILAACASPGEDVQTMNDTAAENSAIDEAEATAETMAETDTLGAGLEGFTQVGTLSDVENGGAISTEIDGKKVYVFQNPTDQSLVALDPTCNHKSCPSALSGDKLVCSCHGSEFALDGSLIKGPATAGLPTYTVQENGGNIFVSLT